ncbi:hypothetical protein DENSPDRAFT_855179 [Dentipellis sp. KUC8613]|nr:hypothetical protein DENSPDRAFT_855179 [Dentipellis sp. KUC8613]
MYFHKTPGPYVLITKQSAKSFEVASDSSSESDQADKDSPSYGRSKKQPGPAVTGGRGLKSSKTYADAVLQGNSSPALSLAKDSGEQVGKRPLSLAKDRGRVLSVQESHVTQPSSLAKDRGGVSSDEEGHVTQPSSLAKDRGRVYEEGHVTQPLSLAKDRGCVSSDEEGPVTQPSSLAKDKEAPMTPIKKERLSQPSLAGNVKFGPPSRSGKRVAATPLSQGSERPLSEASPKRERENSDGDSGEEGEPGPKSGSDSGRGRGLQEIASVSRSNKKRQVALKLVKTSFFIADLTGRWKHRSSHALLSPFGAAAILSSQTDPDSTPVASSSKRKGKGRQVKEVIELLDSDDELPPGRVLFVKKEQPAHSSSSVLSGRSGGQHEETVQIPSSSQTSLTPPPSTQPPVTEDQHMSIACEVTKAEYQSMDPHLQGTYESTVPLKAVQMMGTPPRYYSTTALATPGVYVNLLSK